MANNNAPAPFFDAHATQLSGNLELLARQAVEGFIIGLHKSPFHGFSVEFAEHRLYNPGEATKDIDWKVYARTDRMYSKKFEEETNLRCQIVIDTSSSMYFPEDRKPSSSSAPNTANLNKLEFSALAAATLMNLLRKQRDAFGLSLFAEELENNTRCKSSTMHYRLLLSYLEQLIATPKHDRTSHIARNLHLIAESTHQRSLIVIFSDMFNHAEQPDALFSALQHLKFNKHEIVLFHTVERSKEIEFEYENRPYMFVDMETGERIRLQSSQVKQLYIERVKAIEADLKMKCLQYGIDFIETDIRQPVAQVLMPYLVKRSKMRV